jgi:fatty acid desaturase
MAPGQQGAGPAGTTATASTSPKRVRAQSDYAALAGRLAAAGLMRRRTGYYVVLLLTLVAALTCVAMLFTVLGDSWWQLATAVLLAFTLAQFGFLGHDAAHQQVLSSSRGNAWYARIVSTGVVGLSYGWWTHKHSRHHSAPNQVGRDPDIEPGALVFTREDATRRSRPGRWLTAHQGVLFFPYLLLEGLNLHVASLRVLATRPDLPWRRLEAGVLVLRLGGYLAVVVVVLSPARAAAFLAVQLALFGLFLGGAFAPNHKGMPIVPRDLRVDFLRRQVLMSRNIRGGVIVNVLMGGLNYQIEHHLFPSMPRASLSRARPIVQAFCREKEVRYTETSLVSSYAIVVRYLNAVGMAQGDPFTCPMVQTFRN